MHIFRNCSIDFANTSVQYFAYVEGFGTALAGAGGLNPFFKAGGGQVVDSGISSLVPKPVIYRQESGSLSIDRIKELDRLEALKSLALKRKMGKEKFGVKAIEKPPPLLGPEKITPGGDPPAWIPHFW